MIAEACVRVEKPEHFLRHLEDIGLTLLPFPVTAAIPAAQAFALYLDRLKAEGKPAPFKLRPRSRFPGSRGLTRFNIYG